MIKKTQMEVRLYGNDVVRTLDSHNYLVSLYNKVLLVNAKINNEQSLCPWAQVIICIYYV